MTPGVAIAEEPRVEVGGCAPDLISFSIVVLTYARDDVLESTLQRLSGAIGARRDAEVILVDNNTDGVDRTRFLQRFEAWQLVRTGRNKGVCARNDGMDVARGAIIVLLDDDVLIETPDFLERFDAAFAANPAVGVVNIRKLDGASMSVLAECIPHSRKDMDIDQPFLTFRFIGGLVGFRRAVHRQLGGFNPDLFYGAEEREYSYRIIKAGWKIYYTPDIRAIETNAAGGRLDRAERMTQILTNTYVIAYLHKPMAMLLADVALFTTFLWLKERGQVDLGRAIGDFFQWRRKPGRAARRPLDRRTLAYIRACGGATWR